jgi:hypothetical protein
LARFGDDQLAEFAHLLRLFTEALQDDVTGGNRLKAVGG